MSDLERPVRYKDPSSVLDFTFDWGTLGWLATGETITTSTMTVSYGIIKDSQSNTTTTATAWISGGTAGYAYTLTNRIVTSAGRTDERSMTIKVVNR